MEVQKAPEIETNNKDINKEEDKKRNNKNDDNIQLNEVICFECKENSFINIKNYKINLFGCKNGHNISNISFKDYENKFQDMNQKKLCENCKKNKYVKEFYKCLSCKINMCKNCKLNHNKEQ